MSTTMRPMNSLSVMSPHARARGARAASLPFAAKTSRDVALPVGGVAPFHEKGVAVTVGDGALAGFSAVEENPRVLLRLHCPGRFGGREGNAFCHTHFPFFVEEGVAVAVSSVPQLQCLKVVPQGAATRNFREDLPEPEDPFPVCQEHSAHGACHLHRAFVDKRGECSRKRPICDRRNPGIVICCVPAVFYQPPEPRRRGAM